ncbi:MAG: hypothetical protein ACTSRC_07320 [Candidatus Helarchaeota archaeon]
MDTNFIIDLINGDSNVITLARDLENGLSPVVISVITAYEYLTGIFYTSFFLYFSKGKRIIKVKWNIQVRSIIQLKRIMLLWRLKFGKKLLEIS